MERKEKRIRTVIALVFALIMATYVGNTVFVNRSPAIDMRFVAGIPRSIRETVASFITSIRVPPGTPGDVSPTPRPGDPFGFVTPVPSSLPTVPVATARPTVPPAGPVTPTSLPAQPTTIPTRVPTARPTAKPTALPTPTSAPAVSCPSSSGSSYDPISVVSGKTPDPASQPDINLAVRGFGPANEALTLIDVGGDDDGGKAPQFPTMFSPKRGPDFVTAYRMDNWDWDTNTKGPPIGEPPVTLIGVRAKPGEGIHVPVSQYDIGDGKQVMVLFATKTSLTIKYTREDDIVRGYAIHIDGICVDPELLKLYASLHGSGRSSLPGLAGGQQLGTAQTSEVRIAIRDTGSFMDPRVRKDWWRGY